MATQQQLNSISAKLDRIPEITQTCHDIALALIEANEKVSYGSSVFGFIIQTEYDRARKQIISTCSSTIRDLRNIRRTVLSSEAIKATSYLSHVANCCKACLAENLGSMTTGKSFCCLIETASEENSIKVFRFKLNEKGQIIEQR